MDRRRFLKSSLVAGMAFSSIGASTEKLEIPDSLLKEVSLPFIDLNEDSTRQVVVDKEKGQYLGHPSTVLLEDGRTVLCVYPKGHGGGAIVYKRSTDGGRTWSERLPTPDSWKTSREVPVLARTMEARSGVSDWGDLALMQQMVPVQRRVIMWSGLYPARLAVSEDSGKTWSELKPVGDWGGIVVMGDVVPVNTGQGHYMAMFHDDGRFFKKDGQKTSRFTLYKTFSEDGGLTWSYPEPVYFNTDVHLCEPGIIRSPDGDVLAVLLRENARRKNSHIMFSSDEGQNFTEPREMPLALSGDRHQGVYGPDGRLFISFRGRLPRGRHYPAENDWAAWVGTWDDLVQGKEGQYHVRLKRNFAGADCAYPGVEVLPDGTIVTVTYGHWAAGHEPYILCVRLKLSELDKLA